MSNKVDNFASMTLSELLEKFEEYREIESDDIFNAFFDALAKKLDTLGVVRKVVYDDFMYEFTRMQEQVETLKRWIRECAEMSYRGLPIDGTKD